MKYHLPSPSCVVKVGDGRGFIIEYRVKVPGGNLPRRLKLRLRKFVEHRVVVTAAHCLPKLPIAHAMAFGYQRTYVKLLGSLNGSKTGVSAECMFADPVADIAVLGSPDNQEFYDEAEAYEALTENASILQISNARSGPGWVLALDGHWVRTTLRVFRGFGGSSLSIDPTEAGMSGSPILNDAGRAVGAVVIGAETVRAGGKRKNERAGPQAILTRNLPAWLLQFQR